ncbi:hypothetical protein BROOK1789C_2168 [Bathymodiolus brooksi thiotrophic gill symbiont]|nr:hypothetical protein BROOK1789C_2168 [Bathymodiolus brooksi thiotrophic gill symbiont]
MKINFFKSTGFRYFIVIILLLFVARMVEKYNDSQYEDSRSPYLQMLGKNQVTIKWQGLKKEKVILKYGTNRASLNLTKISEKASFEHTITLNNLSENTQYFYQIAEKIYTFKTAPNKNSNDASLFWVLGDPGNASNLLLNVKKSAYRWLENNHRRQNFDLILTTGDNAYTSGKNQQYQEAIFNVHKEELSSVNLWPAYGNHDARRWAFFDIFDFPTQAQLGGVASTTEEYFSFNYADVHFVFLNSEISAFFHTDAMIDWLKKDLSQNQSKWTVVLFHSPPYTKGSHDSDNLKDSWGKMHYMRENVLPILEKHSVDMVLSGHSHSYERSHLLHCHYGDSTTFKQEMVLDDDGIYQKNSNKYPYDGTLYAVVGSSSKVDISDLDHPALPIAKNSGGSLIIKTHNNVLQGYFLDDKGMVLDNFSIDKSNHNALQKTPRQLKKCK